MRQESSGSSRRAWLVGGLIVVLILVWLGLWKGPALFRSAGDGTPPAAPPETVALPGSETGAPSDTPEEAPVDPDTARAIASWERQLGSVPAWPADLSDPQSCEAVEATLARVCEVIDSRDYMNADRTPGGACGVIRQVAEGLASRPPDLSSELRSYDTMVGNVYHLFRVLGRRRIDLVRRALEEDPELVEPASMAVYRWLVSRDDCARSGRTSIRPEPLYDYATFLFKTLGGQAYLRRRSPETEALASFYSLLIIDQAQAAGYDPHGADPRPEIRRTRELIAGQPFVFRAQYLERLDELDRRWQARSR